MNGEDNRKQALQLKEEGNVFYKDKQYKEAIEKYS